MYWPETFEKDFEKKLKNNVKGNGNDKKYSLADPQIFTGKIISKETPYKSLLLYHDTGVGKSISSINAIRSNPGMNVVFIAKNKSIIKNFQQQVDVFNKLTKFAFIDDISPGNIDFATYGGIVNSQLGRKKKKAVVQEDGDLDMRVDRVIGTGKPIQFLENTLFIMDEVHNTTQNDGYLAIMKILSKLKNYKVILMTATPIFDSVLELFEISNLLNTHSMENQLPVRGALTKGNLVSKNIVNGFSIYQATPLGITKLKEAMFSKVSRVSKEGGENFPKIIEMGSILPTLNFKTIVCQMSKHQEKSYTRYSRAELGGISDIPEMESEEESSGLYKFSTFSSNVVFPNGNTGKDGDFIPAMFKGENLKKHSCKLNEIVENIKKSKGPTVIYTQYVNYVGTKFIEQVLRLNGINGSVVPSLQRTSTLATFNNINNKTGSVIKCLIISASASEGLSFKRVEQLHLFEPAWNMSRIEQIEGRVARQFSHAGLPASKQKVEIYRYIAVGKDIRVSIDYIKYKLSMDKKTFSAEVLDKVKKSSIDCFLYDPINPGETAGTATTATTTENEYQSEFSQSIEINDAKQQLKEYFSPGIKLISLGDLEFLFESFPEDVLYFAIEKLINEGTIGSSGNFYFSTIFGPSILDKRYRLFPRDLTEPTEPTEPTERKRPKRREEPEEPTGPEEPTEIRPVAKRQTELLPGFYGTFKNKFGESDEEFRIIEITNLKKKNTGKVCKTFTKDALLTIYRNLTGTDGDTNLKKSDLCSEITNLLEIV